MASTSIQKLFEHGKRAQTALANMRKREKEATNDLVLRVGTTGAVLAGGIVAGAIDGKWGHDGSPTTEKYGIAAIGPAPINLVGGAVLVAAGLSGVLPGSEYIAGLGASMASFSIGKFVENKIVEKQAK